MVATVRPTYTATADRANGWWAIRVAELPGVFSQARRLDGVEAMARDAIAALLEVDPRSFALDVREILGDEADRLVASAIQARAEAQDRQDAASAKSREAVQALTRLGLPQRDIGRLLELSHQRVGQLSVAARNGPVPSERPAARGALPGSGARRPKGRPSSS